MCIQNYFPKPLKDEPYACTKLILRCTPLIGFLVIYDNSRSVQFYRESNEISRFLDHAKEYSRSQRVAGTISLLIGVGLIILGLPQVMGSNALIGGGLIVVSIAIIHFIIGTCVSHKDLRLLKEIETDAENLLNKVEDELITTKANIRHREKELRRLASSLKLQE